MSTARDQHQGVGARSATDRGENGRRWLPWVALLVLLALVALAVLYLTNVDDENDDPGVDITDDEVITDSAPAIDGPVVATKPNDGGPDMTVEQHELAAWVGHTVVDDHGDKIGKVSDLYMDEATGKPE